ncbi:MAG: hypothetical protein V3T72_03870 [Thermoanaerobaculia bacterium]
MADEIPKLRDRHRRVIDLFASRGTDPRTQTEDCIQLLADERLRAEFAVKLRQFLATLDLVLPRPEGLPYVRDAASLGDVYVRAQRRFRRGLPPLGKAVGRKVQRLIDEHVVALGIDPKIPPLEISDPDFAAHIAKQVSDRAKASEMEHAVRHHIRKKLDEDPVHYRKLSERLEEIPGAGSNGRCRTTSAASNGSPGGAARTWRCDPPTPQSLRRPDQST